MLLHIKSWRWCLLFVVMGFASVVSCGAAAPPAVAVRTMPPSIRVPAPAKLEPSVRQTRLAISAESFCLITASGTLRCRRAGHAGGRGLPYPPLPTGTFTSVVATGREYCGLRHDGTVVCWVGDQMSYEGVPTIFAGRYVALASDIRNVCALTSDREAHCASYQKFDEVVTPSVVPGGPFTHLLANESGICLRSTGAMLCFGSGANFQNQPSACTLQGEFVDGTMTTDGCCGVLANGELNCGARPLLLNGNNLISLQRSPYTGELCGLGRDGIMRCNRGPVLPGRFRQILYYDSLKTMLVGLRPDGSVVIDTVKLAGDPLSFGSPEARENFVSQRFVEVHSRQTSLCGLRADDQVVCMGNIDFDEAAIAAVERQGLQRLDNAGDRVCVHSDRSTACLHAPPIPYPKPAVPNPKALDGWQLDNPRCRLGSDGAITCREGRRARTAKAPSGRYLDVKSGNDFDCAIRTRDASLMCWGEIIGSKKAAVPPAGAYQALALGGVHACAIAMDGTLRCWGNDGYHIVSDAPKSGKYRRLSTRYLDTCAEREDGVTQCWGQSFSELFTVPSTARQAVLVGGGVCAITSENKLACWGILSW